ncbi:MAG: hypothetical protein SNJ70_08525 [Armatimonadota bacterium]
MKKLFAAILLISCFMGSAIAQYTGNWTYEWDFNNGEQGWVKQAGLGRWINPEWEPEGPMLPDDGFSGAGGGNLYIPDGTYYTLSMPNGPVNSFILQADFYLPNLMPLNINPYLPGNGIQAAGIGAIDEYGKRIYVSGRGGPDGARLIDNSWDNVNRDRSWLFEEANVPKADMWDKWITMQLHYNVNNSGLFTAYVYTPWASGVHPYGWYKFNDYAIHPEGARNWETIIIGSVIPTQSSWTQTQVDNVKLYIEIEPSGVVPEPAAIATILVGVLGLSILNFKRNTKQ